MRLDPTPLDGLFVVELDRLADERGFFARTYDLEIFGPIVQMSTSFNARAGTLRGLHFQIAPHGETKLVRCTRGAIFDVVVDLRATSPTQHGWFGTQLAEANGRALVIPKGFAHGFQTLADDTDVLYAMDTPFVGEAARGVRWDDPAFGIEWPPPPDGRERVISERDAMYPQIQP